MEGERGEQGIPGERGHQGEPGHTGQPGHDGRPGPTGASASVLLTRSFENLAEALHKDRRDRRWLAVIAAMVLLLGLFVIGDARQQTKANGRMGKVILAVTGCTFEDTPEECKERVHSAALREGARRIAEVDCAARRKDAGLPAPIPPDSCLSQTPAHVYPGQ